MTRNILIGHISAFLTIIVWGVTFISTKILLEDFTPEVILVCRFILGWLALWVLYPHWLPIDNPKREIMFALAGLSGVTLYFLFENIALTYTFAENAGIIVSTAPFFTAILACKFLKGYSLQLNFLAGFFLAITGISLIAFNGNQLHLNPLGDFLALMAAIVWAIYSIVTRKISQYEFNSLAVTRRIFFYGLIFMIPFSTHFTLSCSSILKPVNLLNFLFLGICASAICFASWTFSIKCIGVVKTSVYIYLVPVVTIIAASIYLNEPFNGYIFSGCLLTISGLLIAETENIKRLFRQ